MHRRCHDAACTPAFVLGGGDGLPCAILKYRNIESVTLVDLTRRSRGSSPRRRRCALNADALNDPAVKVLNEDAFIWPRTRATSSTLSSSTSRSQQPLLGKLYTTSFYSLPALI
jgi:spermidine synthase